MAGRVSVAVPDAAAGTRADRFMADASGLSRAYVQRLISEGRLTSGGRPLRASVLLRAGEALELEVPEVRPLEVAAEAIPLTVVYEDEDLLIVDKPAGLVTHPAPGHAGGTLVNALLARAGTFGGIAGVARPGIVHRLDKDTSGLIMVARHDAAQAYLMAQLKARRVKKTYLALVGGSPSAAVGRIEAPIGRDPRRRTRMAVVPDGRPATTGYRVRERFAGWTLLEVDLVTGRTHQIRVHLASIGHPVAGDPVYATGLVRRGPAGLERLFLHAWRLELAARSGGGLIRVTADLPPELESVLDDLRRSDPGAAGMTVVARGAPAAMLVIISGPSGVGKDTIIEALRRRPRDPDYHYIVTCTTRAPRKGEADGVDYRFLSTADFSALREAGELLEWAEVHGHWYGTPRREVVAALQAGRDVILKIDVQGAQAVKSRVADALLVFVVPPSLETLFARLRSRATELADELEVRQRNAAIELARQQDYDYVVVNETGQVDRTAEQIDTIVAAERARHPRRRIRL